MSTIRIGQGYDVHRFSDESNPENTIVLGGVSIGHPKTLEAHSDGDVLLHAICDALLGSLALGDIGHHFPDTSSSWKNADSRELLKGCYQLVSDKGYCIVNVDVCIIAQNPKMAPYIVQMRENIARDLACELSQISVKATTTEKLGFTGREEGIACQVSLLIEKVKA